MAYQINAKNIVIDSDGKAILITDEQIFAGTVTSGSTAFDLSENYFDLKFPSYGGKTAGYTAGGFNYQATPYGNNDIIQTFPFASDANSTDHGDLAQGRKQIAGASSTTHGYAMGGVGHGGTQNSNIDKFPFSSNSGSSTVGNLTTTGVGNAAGCNDGQKGFMVSGFVQPTYQIFDNIQMVPFASDTNATDVGDIRTNQGRQGGAGQSSADNGYITGGRKPSTTGDIDKFPFAISGGSSALVGSYVGSIYFVGGVSSPSHGYVLGGAPDTDTIKKFPFTSDGDATDVGDLTFVTDDGGVTGVSGRTHGYGAGGQSTTPSPGSYTNIIQKFPFATDTNATDVGDLTNTQKEAGGHQV